MFHVVNAGETVKRTKALANVKAALAEFPEAKVYLEPQASTVREVRHRGDRLYMLENNRGRMVAASPERSMIVELEHPEAIRVRTVREGRQVWSYVDTSSRSVGPMVLDEAVQLAHELRQKVS